MLPDLPQLVAPCHLTGAAQMRRAGFLTPFRKVRLQALTEEPRAFSPVFFLERQPATTMADDLRRGPQTPVGASFPDTVVSRVPAVPSANRG